MDVRGYISICMNSSLIITNSLCLEFKVYFNNLHPLCCCGDFKQIYDKERLHAGTKAPSRANQQAVHLPFLNGGKRKEMGQRNLTVFCVGLKSGSVSCDSNSDPAGAEFYMRAGNWTQPLRHFADKPRVITLWGSVLPINLTSLSPGTHTLPGQKEPRDTQLQL